MDNKTSHILSKHITENNIIVFNTVFSKYLSDHKNTTYVVSQCIQLSLQQKKDNFITRILHTHNTQQLDIDNFLIGFYEAHQSRPDNREYILNTFKSLNLSVSTRCIFTLYTKYDDFFLRILEQNIVSLKRDTTLLHLLFAVRDLTVVIKQERRDLFYRDVIDKYKLTTREEAYKVGMCLSNFTEILHTKYNILFDNTKISQILECFDNYLYEYKSVGLSGFYDVCLTQLETRLSKSYYGNIIQSFYREDRHDLFIKHLNTFSIIDKHYLFGYTLSISEDWLDNVYDHLYKNEIKISLTRVYFSLFYERKVSLYVYELYKRLSKGIHNQIIDSIIMDIDKDIMKKYITEIVSTRDCLSSDVLKSIPMKVLLKYVKQSGSGSITENIDGDVKQNIDKIIKSDIVDTRQVIYDKITITPEVLAHIYYINIDDYITIDEFLKDLQVFCLDYVDDNKYNYISTNVQKIKQDIVKIQCLENSLNRNICKIIYRYI